MTPEARAHYAELEKNKRLVVPVRNISNNHPKHDHSVEGILAGAVGLVSEVQLAMHRDTLKRIVVEGWDSEGFEEGDPIKPLKAKAQGGADNDE